MTGVSLGGLTIEAANPPEVAAFWSRVLGGTMSTMLDGTPRWLRGSAGWSGLISWAKSR